MAGFFTVTALAIAAERANAVGVVRLTCLPEGLSIELVRAAGFRAGFAPGTVAEQVSFTVPFTAVRGLVRHGRTLALALDPAIVTPHNRFALVRFTGDPDAALSSTYRARVIARWVRYLIPPLVGLFAASAAPPELVSGPLGEASLGLLAALATWAALEGLFRWLTWGGPISDQYRDAFERELSRRLGLLPTKPVVSSPLAASPWDEAEAPARRLAAGWVIAVISIGLVGIMAFLKQFASGPAKDAPPASAALATGIGSAATVVGHVELPAPGSDRPRCSCERADSPLFQGGIPALSVLLFSQPDDGSGVVAPTVREGGKRRRRPRYDFDLAVVNNASRPLHDVRIVLTFARRDEHDQRVGVTDRGLFWEGALAPGRAVKWHVRAPGTEMRIEPSVTGTLEAMGESLASPDAYAKLVSSRYRIVRIHAAKMLAYLRDPRAEDALRSLGSASTAEALTLARIGRAAAPIFACDVAVSAGHLTACVFNAEAKPAAGLSLAVVPAEGSQPGLSFPIEGVVAVHEGTRVSFPFEGPEGPVEVSVERAP